MNSNEIQQQIDPMSTLWEAKKGTALESKLEKAVKCMLKFQMDWNIEPPDDIVVGEGGQPMEAPEKEWRDHRFNSLGGVLYELAGLRDHLTEKNEKIILEDVMAPFTKVFYDMHREDPKSWPEQPVGPLKAMVEKTSTGLSAVVEYDKGILHMEADNTEKLMDKLKLGYGRLAKEYHWDPDLAINLVFEGDAGYIAQDWNTT